MGEVSTFGDVYLTLSDYSSLVVSQSRDSEAETSCNRNSLVVVSGEIAGVHCPGSGRLVWGGVEEACWRTAGCGRPAVLRSELILEDLLLVLE